MNREETRAIRVKFCALIEERGFALAQAREVYTLSKGRFYIQFNRQGYGMCKVGYKAAVAGKGWDWNAPAFPKDEKGRPVRPAFITRERFAALAMGQFTPERIREIVHKHLAEEHATLRNRADLAKDALDAFVGEFGTQSDPRAC